MAIPHAVLAAAWIPFVVVLVLILLFAFIYIRYYQSKYDSELCSTITAILGLVVALLTSALVPVDIFIVSYMKYSNGTFKDWANESAVRDDLANGVLYAYYALYLCVMLCVFFMLPFAYFFYEEGDEETTTRSRCCTALKYSSVFVLMAAILLTVGAFVPLKGAPGNATNSEWDKFKNIFNDLNKNHGEDAISFSISSLTLVGMIGVIIYTAYGMSSWPMDLLKGRRSITKERLDVSVEQDQTHTRIEQIRKRYRGGRTMSARDRQRLDDLEEQEEFISRREHHLVVSEKSCLRKCAVLLRPFQIVFGIVFFLMALLVFISLLLTNIDKIMHSSGPKTGYALPERNLPNPVDIALVFAQKAFPMDYILMAAIIAYFFFCSMGGIRDIGVWFCWIRMYKIRPRKTKPQGLLFLCFLLMFIVLALNVTFYQIAPQYSMYGSQHYWVNKTVVHNNGTIEVPTLVPCSTKASPDQCIMTRMTMLLTRFFYKMWFFGAAYFWASWAFLGVFVLGFLIVVIRKRRSTIEGQLDRDDMDDSDDELVRP